MSVAILEKYIGYGLHGYKVRTSNFILEWLLIE